MRYEELTIEGRNAVLEAFRSGKTIDKLFVLDGCQDGPVRTIVREAKKHDTIISYVAKERLDQLSETGKHQGVIAYAAAYEYAQVEDMLKLAQEKGNRPFYSCWTALRILIIWEPSSARLTWPVLTASLFPRDGPWGLPLRWQRHRQGL